MIDAKKIVGQLQLSPRDFVKALLNTDVIVKLTNEELALIKSEVAIELNYRENKKLK